MEWEKNTPGCPGVGVEIENSLFGSPAVVVPFRCGNGRPGGFASRPFGRFALIVQEHGYKLHE